MPPTSAFWNGRGKLFVEGTRTLVRIARNTLMRAVRRSDYTRWTSPGGLEQWWSDRTDALARLVPAASRVIEFGAGKRYLEQLLPSCTYTPLDLVDRGPGTIVCDLNRRPLPDLRDRRFTVAVFGGVLEYVKDVPSLVTWLGSIGIETAIVSFDPVPTRLSATGRVREHLRRFYFGYMNSLTEGELIKCFERVDLLCAEKQAWTHQIIIRFAKQR